MLLTPAASPTWTEDPGILRHLHLRLPPGCHHLVLWTKGNSCSLSRQQTAAEVAFYSQVLGFLEVREERASSNWKKPGPRSPSLIKLQKQNSLHNLFFSFLGKRLPPLLERREARGRRLRSQPASPWLWNSHQDQLLWGQVRTPQNRGWSRWSHSLRSL